MQDFRKLLVWRKAHTTTLRVYRESQAFPSHEIYGLTAQLRRACVSVEANIAEGAGRGRPSQLAAFLEIASGSVSEVDCLLELGRDLGYLPRERHAELQKNVVEVRKMLFALTERVREGIP